MMSNTLLRLPDPDFLAVFATTVGGGKTYQVEYYSLDAIISVGYRVNSKRGTQFRIWAPRVLRDHIVKGDSGWGSTEWHPFPAHVPQ